jgi:hypothetical protein
VLSVNNNRATFTPKPGFKVSPKGKVVHTSTGDQISLQVAMAEGLVFIQSTEDKKDLPEQQTVFGAVTYMTKPGFKVDSKGKVTNKNTGETMPLSEALVKGVVFSHSTDDAGKLVQPSGEPHSSDYLFGIFKLFLPICSDVFIITSYLVIYSRILLTYCQIWL